MNRSLHGLRVLNTRPQEQAQPLSARIQAAQGIAIELPTLEIQATDDWLGQLPDLKSIQQAIFISANAVQQCFMQLQQAQIHWPSTIKVIAIGNGSATMLKQFAIQVHATPLIADSEHLLALPSLKHPQKQKILLFKGEGGRPLIEESLLQQGAELIALNVYQRVLPKINDQFIKSIWRDDLVDIILLTSEQSMRHLFQLFPKDAHHWLRSKTCLVISERLAQSASSLGIKHIIRSHPEGIMNALFDSVIKD
ncbi:uroporphyrinogen-III synthase [Legionella rowbothamii]|uniref:uroporphyrinogen-III synthase n=1 Tax=Legionella rowbothamii TaxID=96229 RepID=UPI001056A05B|nr:uroporphyrinogen-III synthase [Legionella rowbothamii]